MLKLLYFAWVRERTGTASEELELPDNVSTVADLITVLRAKGDGYADAFESDDLVRVAGQPEPRRALITKFRLAMKSRSSHRLREANVIRVQEQDFDLGDELRGMSDGNHGIGGLCSFVGLVRDMAGGREYWRDDA